MMRKGFIALLLALVLLLPGCTHDPQAAGPASQENSQTEERYYGEVNTYIPTFTTLEDYEKYVAEDMKLESFVSYDMISEYGEFISFINYGLVQPCTNYKYNLKDAAGYEVAFHVNSIAELEKEDAESLQQVENSKDMRTNGTKTGIYCANGIGYGYFEGKLKSIYWEHDGKRILLRSRRGHLEAYPAGSDTLIGQLLNVETAKEAVLQVNRNVVATRSEK